MTLDEITALNADFYECGDPDMLSWTDPVEAIERYVDLHLSPACDTEAEIRAMSGVTLTAYRKTGRPLVDGYDDRFECDEIGSCDLDADEVIALLRKEHPELFE